ncbi:DNA methyltransferase [Helicobacter cappadocius]|uniref:Methyltransferase n=1 Tax=Helicobacter cappadocius TaxID=3063998 RepID=A0AA90TC26_9HELI|nr:MULTISPECIES: DNA methyltransferase [unclassified Helicobacter]MDO7253479.1 DNA methyltransferase [Helicobacter sp. faydin-H75]MDP2539406.1 DNA methyltransferase [Helicobacter sp. faydin-H76]
MNKNSVIFGDCLDITKNIDSGIIDLIYLDPPFFTNKIQKQTTKDRSKILSFNDNWKNCDEYADFLFLRFVEFQRILKNTGSIFVHCDINANHIVRLLLDSVFGFQNFQSEIIWTYKRWSNSKKGLLRNHQNIYFYSKSKNFKFNFIYQDYSPATNIDQILQQRKRDEFGKSIYAKDSKGEVIISECKKGVPLSDVWDIPYLNPKAKERIQYPTQKPIALLERIIKIASSHGDLILDPFCGSGTTLLAAKLNNRNFIGIDISQEAVKITKERLENPIKTHSVVLHKGRDYFLNQQIDLEKYLFGVEFIPVQRNNGIDAILKQQFNNAPILIKIQKENESLYDAYQKLQQAIKIKKSQKSFLIQTHSDVHSLLNNFDDHRISIVKNLSAVLESEKIFKNGTSSYLDS